MITLTALVALLGLGCLVQHLWKRAVERAARTLAEAQAAAAATPARAP